MSDKLQFVVYFSQSLSRGNDKLKFIGHAAFLDLLRSSIPAKVLNHILKGGFYKVGQWSSHQRICQGYSPIQKRLLGHNAKSNLQSMSG